MHNSQELANTIKEIAKERGMSTGNLLSKCGLSKNALSSMQSGGFFPRVDALCRIAEELDVSVDYLLGRKLEANGESVLTPKEAELLRLYRKADVNGQFKIIAAAMNATGKKEKPHLVPGTAIAAYGGGVISDPPVEDDIIT